MQVNIHEGKAKLSALIEEVLKGNSVTIAKAGQPLIDLVPHIHTPQKRRSGRFKNCIIIAADFDEDKTNEEVEALFYGDAS